MSLEEYAMISATAAAERYRLSKSTICKWCREHILRGAVKATPSESSAWLIPLREFDRPEIVARIQLAHTARELQERPPARTW